MLGRVVNLVSPIQGGDGVEIYSTLLHAVQPRIWYGMKGYFGPAGASFIVLPPSVFLKGPGVAVYIPLAIGLLH